MASPLDRHPSDLGLKHQTPKPDFATIPIAQEFTLENQIAIETARRGRRAGWVVQPKFTPTGKVLRIYDATFRFKLPAQDLALDTTIEIPGLGNPAAIIKRDDQLYIVGLCLEVGAAQDPILGQVSLRYKEQSTATIKTETKENSRRYRFCWGLLLTSAPITVTDFIAALTLETNGDRRLKIDSVLDAGFTFGTNGRFYAKDPNWVANGTYTVSTDSIEISPVAIVRRIQNYTEGGYTYGYGGEEDLSTLSIATLAEPLDRYNLDADLRRRVVQEVAAGKPGRGATFQRTVQNLLAGQVGGNPGRPGDSASSPNNSAAIANDQRISFTNQAALQKLGVTVVTAGNDGNGRAIVSVGLNTNAPLGSTFSSRKEDHRVFSASGVDQSAFGAFSNLGGSGSLLWTATDNSTIKPGNSAYFVPAIRYPAGSGFGIPFLTVEKMWKDGAAIAVANIRKGITDDLAAYEDPANNEAFIAVVGSERAALHYVYKKITITSNAQGVAAIPPSERGCFAFIQGVSGRIDSPVKTGLIANQTYNALVYYPPRSNEAWQLQMQYCGYQGRGTSEPTFLNGATIITPGILYAHTQGGGLSVHQGDAILRNSPIAFHLPTVGGSVPYYTFDAPLQLLGEAYNGPITFREIELTSASGYALPAPGQVISLTTRATTYAKSIGAALFVEGDRPLGFRAPVLASKTPFQCVLAFGVQKGGERRIAIATNNTAGIVGKNVVLDTALETAIDTFYF
jgi:hypothetical protein